MNYIVLNPLTVKTEAPEKKNIRACHGCLDTKEKLHDIRGSKLQYVFTELTGLQVNSGLLCCICKSLLQRFREFRVRCLNSSYILRQVETLNEDLCSIDRTNLQHNLAKTKVLTLSYHPLQEETKQFLKRRRQSVDDNELYYDLSTDDEIETNVTKTDDISVNVKTNQTVESLNETRQHYGDDERSKDSIRKEDIEDYDDIETTKDGKDEKEDIEENKSSDDDFAWPDDSNDLSITGGTNKKKCKENPGEKFLSDHDYNLCPVQNLDEGKGMNSVLERISQVFGMIRKEVEKNKVGLHELFESFYEESLKHTADYDKDDLDYDKQLIWKLLSLHKQLESICSLKIEFLSLDKQMQDMEEKRKSGQLEDVEVYCNLCYKKYANKEALDRHVDAKHNRNFRFKCRICLYRFKQKWRYWNHLLNHNRRVTCKNCPLFFRQNWSSLQEHMETHEGKTLDVKCNFCSKILKNKSQRFMHIRQCHRDRMDFLKCLLCGDTYNGLNGLYHHIPKIHREAVRCKKCKIYFENSEVLAAHLLDDGCIDGNSSCSVCGANFTTQELMMEHYQKQCSRTPKKRIQKRKNQNVKPPLEPQKQYKKSFDSVGKLEAHKCRLLKKRTDALDRKRQEKEENLVDEDMKLDSYKYVCEYCGKHFKQKLGLQCHVRKHTGERPYECEVCHKKYAQETLLKFHRRKHTGQRFQCNVCKKTYAGEHYLKIHQRVHTGARPYQCPHCPNAFRQSSHLHAHMPSHTKVKAHVCGVCGKSFTQRCNMMEHARVIHEGKPARRKRRKKQLV